MSELEYRRVHMKHFAFIILATFFLLFFLTGGDMHGQTNSARITITFDNYEYNPDCTTGWGFSCMIDTGSAQILFDTGADGKTLLKNMRALELNVSDIDAVVISHMHGDHTGGLFAALEQIGACTVYFPVDISRSASERISRTGANCVVSESFAEIFPHIYTTGPLGRMIREQALVIDTQKGLVVVTGCAHPGVVRIVEAAARHFKKEIAFVMGGFHLFSTDPASIQKIIERLRTLGVKKVAPCHCSGDRARSLFQDDYGKNYIEVGVGRVVTLEEL
jgi:7,8-dihydropterin-6-yl-methyl-4-(beta-D-ribofuranosyl)aminobenzene 5'-phosphate synthase